MYTLSLKFVPGFEPMLSIVHFVNCFSEVGFVSRASHLLQLTSALLEIMLENFSSFFFSICLSRAYFC